VTSGQDPPRPELKLKNVTILVTMIVTDVLELDPEPDFEPEPDLEPELPEDDPLPAVTAVVLAGFDAAVVVVELEKGGEVTTALTGLELVDFKALELVAFTALELVAFTSLELVDFTAFVAEDSAVEADDVAAAVD
jgi:hypothetical protein